MSMEKINSGGAPGKAALFDLDGVLIDTETQYTAFWAGIGKRFVPDVPDFAQRMKGETLRHIFDTYFPDMEERQAELSAALSAFEQTMGYPLMPGAEALVAALRSAGWHTAVVTSSNREKMANVYAANPGLEKWFDRVFTAEDTARSKPEPDPYLGAGRFFGLTSPWCVVFEDSLNGVRAGHAAGMAVVGLSTTLPVSAIAPYCRVVVPDLSALAVADVEALLV